MDEREIEQVFECLRRVYDRFLEAHYNHLDGHQTLPAEFCKAECEAVQAVAREITYTLHLDLPVWATHEEEMTVCLSNTWRTEGVT